MHINSTTNTPFYLSRKRETNETPVSFRANPNSHILEFTYNDFFINIKGYGKDMYWAQEVRQLADKATEKVKTSKSSDEVLPYIATGIRGANGTLLDVQKRMHSGVIRTNRLGYGPSGEWKGQDLVTKITHQYAGYKDKLKNTHDNPLKNPYDDISITTVDYNDFSNCLELSHGTGLKINNALDRVGGKFFNLKKNYISHPECVTEKTLPEINSDVAEIRWILAHSMPWERGSDAISNVFIRALYKSMGIKTYPLKEGISLDLQAFCTPLKEYKQNFASYFEKEPHVVG